MTSRPLVLILGQTKGVQFERRMGGGRVEHRSIFWSPKKKKKEKKERKKEKKKKGKIPRGSLAKYGKLSEKTFFFSP